MFACNCLQIAGASLREYLCPSYKTSLPSGLSCVWAGKSLLRSRAPALRLPCSQPPAVTLQLEAIARRPVVVAAQTRGLSFSFPGPRKLGDITNLPLLEKVRTATA